jgi:monoamine oxidase
MTDAQLEAGALDALRTMFGASAVQQPVRTLITRWRSDPYSKGSYSYVAVGAAGNARARLCERDGPQRQIFFAGEACSIDYPSTVQGAWNTGAAAARDVIAFLRR